MGVEQRDNDGRHERRLSENPRNLNPLKAYHVYGRHNHEMADFHLYTGTTRPRPRRCALPNDQLAVPSTNGVRRDDRRDFHEDPAAQALSDDRETPTVVIIQPQPPAVQLRFQDAVLFAQEFDDLVLLLLEPAE
jgi:hypothetical protein